MTPPTKQPAHRSDDAGPRGDRDLGDDAGPRGDRDLGDDAVTMQALGVIVISTARASRSQQQPEDAVCILPLCFSRRSIYRPPHQLRGSVDPERSLFVASLDALQAEYG